MKPLTSRCTRMAALLTAVALSCGAFNVTILVIHRKNDVTSIPDYSGSTRYDVRHVNDSDIFQYWETEYYNDHQWLVVLDTRTNACPYHLFYQRLLGYVTLYPEPCPSSGEMPVLHVKTIPFDYRRLVVGVGNFSGTRSTSVAVLFDDTGLDYQKQVSMCSFNHFLFNLVLAIPRDKIPEVLATMTVKTDARYVFLMGASDTIGDVLKEASHLHMLAGRYYWLVFSTDGLTPSRPDSSNASIIIIKDPNNAKYVHKKERLVSFAEAALADIMDSSSLMFDHACNCPVPCEECQTLFGHSLRKVSGTGSGVFLRDAASEAGSRLFLYKYRGDDSSSLTKVGEWSPSTMVRADRSLFLGDSRAVVLRVVTIVEPPFVFRNESGGYYGYTIDVLNDISQIVGFTYTVRECADGHYGNLHSNRVWTGCIKNILQGDADIIAGSLTVTADREAVVDFTLPYYDFAGIQIVMQKQNREIYLFYFADVFTPLAWLCLGVVIAVTSLLLMFFDRYTPITNSSAKSAYGIPLKSFDLKESIWFVVGSLTMSGAGAPPRSTPARLLVAGFWFFSVIMMSTFTANLAAFLTVSRMNVAINSMTEMAARPDIRYSVLAESSVMSYFQRMAAIEENFYSIWKAMSMGNMDNYNGSLAVWDYPLGDKYVNIWRSMEDTGLLNSTEEALERISKGGFAFVTDSPVIKYLTNKNCHLTAVGDVFSIRPYAFGLKEKSLYTRKISTAILDLQKQRKLEALKRRWWEDEKLDCPDSSSDQGLDLKSLTGSFIVVALGIGSGLLVLSIEYSWDKFSKKKIQIRQMKKSMSTASTKEDTPSEKTEATELGSSNSEEQFPNPSSVEDFVAIQSIYGC